MSLHGAGGGGGAGAGSARAGYAGSPWSSQSGINELDGTLPELEPLGEMTEVGFEPQVRARSNTWPLPRPDNYIEPADDSGSKKNSNTHLPSAGAPPLPSPASVAAKKNSSRRNAWGNLSYADLITQAITSAPDTRLTLSQIYEWMVQNVPYFKDKGDSNSSAGWKNSIRHNLSLHNRFMRVQNEGTGKSSWWMINPDAKPGKSVRRRAASMETSKYEKKRGRVKKKVENLRNGMPADTTPSPSSSVSEGLDMFPDSPMHSGGFQLSPDFRQRTASNASSTGRLSPIPSMLQQEPEWGADYTTTDFTTDFSSEYAQSEQLAGSLADSMKLQHSADPFLNTYVPTTSSGGVVHPGGYRGSYGGGGGGGYGACPRHPHGACACGAALSPAYPAHPHLHHRLEHFVRPPPPADSADHLHAGSTMVTTQDTNLMNGGLMVESQGIPTTVMGQLMGALNTGLIEDFNLNIETLEHGGFDCNVDEVIKHELSVDGMLDFNFPQQQQQCVGGGEGYGAAPAPAPAPPAPAPAPAAPHTSLDDALRAQPRQQYSVAPSWVH